MANKSAKNTVKENSSTLQKLKWAFVAVYGIYGLLHVVLSGFSAENSSWTWLPTLASFSTTFAIYYQLSSMARPKYSQDGAVLVSSGMDLSSPGLVQYMFDIIYLVWISQLLSLITSYAWMLLLSIPGYAFWKVGGYAWPYVSKYFSSRSSAGQTQSISNRQLKREKKGNSGVTTKYR